LATSFGCTHLEVEIFLREVAETLAERVVLGRCEFELFTVDSEVGLSSMLVLLIILKEVLKRLLDRGHLGLLVSA